MSRSLLLILFSFFGFTNHAQLLSVGTTAGTTDVSGLGSAEYTIPIGVPKGIAGLQPELTLKYNSSSPNGILGMGWSLAGGSSAVSRTPNTIYNDKKVAGISLTNDDKFELDGRRLVVTTANYGAAGSKYRTEIESFNDITANGTLGTGPASFTVINQTGVTYEYGLDLFSRAIVPGKLDAYSWLLSKVTDLNGNYITYQYQVNGIDEPRITSIEYTGNNNTGILPQSRVLFIYEDRPDLSFFFVTGGKLNRNKRLKEIGIESKSGSGTYVRVHTYKFEYELDFYSHLTKISEAGIGDDGIEQKMEPTIFNYGTPGLPAIETIHSNLSLSANYAAGDFNADGKSDFIRFPTASNTGGSSQAFLFLNTTSGMSQVQSWTLPTVLPQSDIRSARDFTDPLAFFDYNGDGKEDLCYVATHPKQYVSDDLRRKYFLMLSNGTQLVPSLPIVHPVTYSDLLSNTSPLVGDFDGDGKSEILLLNNQLLIQNNNFIVGEEYNTQVQNGSTTVLLPKQLLNLPFDPYDISLMSVIDYNGDRKSDLMIKNGSDFYIYEFNITFDATNHPVLGTPLLKLVSQTNIPSNFNYFYRIYDRDFNGDGITDLLTAGYHTPDWYCTWNLHYGKGDGGFAPPVAMPYFGGNYNPMYNTPGTAPMYLEDPKENLEEKIFDFNGDGKYDVYIKNVAASTPFIKLYYSQGNNNFLESPAITIPDRVESFTNNGAGDYNGDGIIDFLYPPGSSGALRTLSFHQNEQSHLVSLIIDGLGAYTRIKYDYLTNPSVYTPGALNYSYPFIKKILPLRVVSSVNQDNGIDYYGNTLTYTYTGLQYHACGKGILAFNGMSILDITNDVKTENSYAVNTTYAFPYLSSTSIQQGVSTANAIPIRLTVNDYNFYHYGGNRIWPYPTQMDVFDYLKNTHTKTTNSYSIPPVTPQVNTVYSTAIGKPTSTTVDKGDGIEVITQSFTYPPIMDFSAGVLNPVFVYSKPKSLITTTVRQGEPAFTRRQDFVYSSSTGQLDIKYEDPNTSNTVISTFVYDPYGNVESTTQSASGIVPRTIIKQYDPTKRFITASYNNTYPNIKNISDYNILTGNLVTSSDPDGFIVNTSSDAFRRLITTENNNGAATTATYTNGSNGDAPWGTSYYSITTSNTASPSYSFFDRLGRLLRKAYSGFDGNMVYADNYYDTKGQLVATSDPYFAGSAGNYNYFSYDDLGRLILEERPEGNTTYSYEIAGSLYKTTVTDPAGLVKRTYLDASGQLVKTEDEGGALEYDYCSNGNVKNIKLNGNLVNEFEYDDFGRQKKATDPNYGSYEYTYNAYNELILQKDPKNNIYTFSYNDLGKLIQKTGPEGIYNYTYYSGTGPDCGKLTRLTGMNGKIDYKHDKGSKQQYEERTFGSAVYRTQYGYDVYGRLKSLTFPNNTVIEYTYNTNDGSLSGIGLQGETYSVPGQGVKPAYLYAINSKDASGRVLEFGQRSKFNAGTFGTPQFKYSTSQQYDDYGQLRHQTTIIPATSSSPSATLRDFEYFFDPTTGNLLQRKDLKYSLQEDFGFDNVKRLSTAQGQTTGPFPVMYPQLEIDYTDEGNISQKSDAGTFAYDQANRVSEIDPYVNIPSATQNLTYTPFNKVSILEQSDGKANYFAYWPDETRYIMGYFENGTAIKHKFYTPDFERERDESTGAIRDLCYVKGPDGRFVSIIEKKNGNTNIFSVLTDHLGSITQILDESGNIAEEKSFDAWGRSRNPQNWILSAPTTASNGWDRGYTGHEHMPQAGIINMSGRLYDPLLGRMFSPDPLIMGKDNSQGYNRYTYALNNPLRYSDPSGFTIEDQTLNEVVIRGQRNPFQDEIDMFGTLSEMGRQMWAFQMARRAQEAGGYGGPYDFHESVDNSGYLSLNNWDDAVVSPEADPSPEPAPQGDGGIISPASFQFKTMNSNTFEAGVSNVTFEVRHVKGATRLFAFQNLYVQFPSRTKDGRTYSTVAASNITAEAFQAAATTLALTMNSFTQTELRGVSDKQVQNWFVANAIFFINEEIRAGATVTNFQCGPRTTTTPAIWRR